LADDVRNLLGQLGQPDFPYREFRQDAEEGGYWPVFRVVIGHPLLAHLPGARLRPHRGEPAPAPAPVAAGAMPRAAEEGGAFMPPPAAAAMPAAPAGTSSIFRRYRERAPLVPDQPPPSRDIRGLLRRLSGEPR